jgi:hypothetical protein
MRRDIIMIGSLAAASFVAITQILTIGSLDWCLFGAVCIFAVSIPLLVKVWMKPPPAFSNPPTLEEFTGAKGDPFWEFLFVMLFSITGFALMFFHFGWLSGCLFSASAFLCIWLVLDCAHPKMILKVLKEVAVFPVRKLAVRFHKQPPKGG